LSATQHEPDFIGQRKKLFYKAGAATKTDKAKNTTATCKLPAGAHYKNGNNTPAASAPEKARAAYCPMPERTTAATAALSETITKQ